MENKKKNTSETDIATRLMRWRLNDRHQLDVSLRVFIYMYLFFRIDLKIYIWYKSNLYSLVMSFGRNFKCRGHWPLVLLKNISFVVRIYGFFEPKKYSIMMMKIINRQTKIHESNSMGLWIKFYNKKFLLTGQKAAGQWIILSIGAVSNDKHTNDRQIYGECPFQHFRYVFFHHNTELFC